MKIILTEHVAVRIWDENNDQVILRLVQGYWVCTKENNILSYISQYIRHTCAAYMGITCSPLPQSNGYLPLPFFDGN